MKNFTIKEMTKQSLIASIYVVLTLSAGELAFGAYQFRYSEVLNLLAFYNPFNVIGVTLGVFVSNFWSTLGFADLIFGTLHTLISLVLISRTKIFMSRTANLLLASLFPTIFAFIIGFELSYIAKFDSFYIMTLNVMVSEFIIMTLISVPLYKALEQSSHFIKLIGRKDRLDALGFNFNE